MDVKIFKNYWQPENFEIFGVKNQKKWSFPNLSQVISGHFWSIQDIKNMILERFKLPENQKNYEQLKNSKLAQKM